MEYAIRHRTGVRSCARTPGVCRETDAETRATSATIESRTHGREKVYIPVACSAVACRNPREKPPHTRGPPSPGPTPQSPQLTSDDSVREESCAPGKSYGRAEPGLEDDIHSRRTRMIATPNVALLRWAHRTAVPSGLRAPPASIPRGTDPDCVAIVPCFARPRGK